MSPEFDPRIADWLEDDPDDAPDAVLVTVLAAFPSISQRHASRVPWRTRPMTMTTRLLAGAAAIAVVLLGGVLLLRPGGSTGPGAPSPSAPAVPTGSASGAASPSAAASLDKTFSSDRYGYTVAYPGSWSVSPATSSWTAGAANNWGSGLNDELKGRDIRFSGASQALAKGQTADAWLREYGSPVGALAGQGADPTTWPTVTIGGLQGSIDIDGGPAAGGTIAPGGRMFDAVVIAGRLAYNFNMDGNVDRAIFEAFLTTVKLPVVPALDKTFTSPMDGYAIQYPSAWSVTPATKAWTTGYDTSDPALSDTIGSKPSFVGTSTRLPRGSSFETWYASYDAARRSGTCGALPLEETVTVDEVVARLDVHCPTFYLEAVVSTGGRVYVLTMYAPASRPLFQAFLDTVRLEPASATN